MSEDRRTRRQRSRTSGEGTAFMDVAREAFVRSAALDKWREVEDLRRTLDLAVAAAVREAGHFPNRGPYGPLWRHRWAEEVVPAASASDAGRLFAAIERAVAAALADEAAERRRRGDRPIEEDVEYRAFLDAAFERLHRDATGATGIP